MFRVGKGEELGVKYKEVGVTTHNSMQCEYNTLQCTIENQDSDGKK